MAGPKVIDDTNLSHAWARAVAHVLTHPGTEIAPLLVTIRGFNENGVPTEDQAIRTQLDQLLRGMGKLDVEHVAYPIFPQRLWTASGGDRHRFYGKFKRAFRSYKALNPGLNRRGWYFQRLIDYGAGPLDGNQLEWIIQRFRSRPGVRRSMLQASIFKSQVDHTASAQLGFPCMQHISFAPSGTTLSLNAFYATQQLVQKAYGNYVGLAHLGAYVATAMGLNLHQINVFAGIAKVEGIDKTDPVLNGIITPTVSTVTKSPLQEAPVVP